MNIAVIAANGRTGIEFVKVALENGHNVKAGVYGKHDFEAGPNLEILETDATDPAQLQKLISGTDAVASFIGHGKKSPATVQTEAINNAIAICKKLAVDRLVSLTGTGVRFDGDKITLLDRLLNFSIGTIDPKRVSDGKSHVESLKNCDLDWTVIRVLKLTNGPIKGYKLTTNGPTTAFASRTTVARAVLEVLENDTFLKQAPMISNTT